MRIGPLEIRYAPALTPIGDNRGGWLPTVREPYTGAWQRNQEWTTDSVTRHTAVYACMSRIAQDIGKLRPKLMELTGDRIWQETESATFSRVLRRPNRYQNYIQFQESWIFSKLLHGNAYVLKERDNRGGEFQGAVRAMYLLDPTRVAPMLAPDGDVLYQLKEDRLSGVDRSEVAVPASEIIHDRFNCLFHPLVGTSPIFASGAAATVGLNIENNSRAFFRNGSSISGILSSPTTITKQKQVELQEQWISYSGDNAGFVAVVGDGMKFEPMQMSAVDSQLIDQLKWSAEQVCSAFHVPPFKIGAGNQPTFQNGEILNQIYYSDCLQALIEQFELCMDEALGLTTTKEGGRRMGVELDLDGLLRMDTASQVKTLAEAVGGSIMVPNEARRRLDLPPKMGGDSIWMQQQNYSLEALAERDRNDPFAKPPPPPALPPATDTEESEDAPADDEAEEERIAARLRKRASRRARNLRMRMVAT